MVPGGNLLINHGIFGYPMDNKISSEMAQSGRIIYSIIVMPVENKLCDSHFGGNVPWEIP
jgi:hypothetical protein